MQAFSIIMYELFSDYIYIKSHQALQISGKTVTQYIFTYITEIIQQYITQRCIVVYCKFIKATSIGQVVVPLATVPMVSTPPF